MTALVWALAVGLIAATGAVVTFALLGRKDAATLRDVVDLLDGQRKLVAEYKHKFDTELVAHTVTSERLRTEQNLRAVAEAQRNEAMRKSRAYLARSMERATEDDVNAVLADLFASPLSVVPRPEAGTPEPSGDGLYPFPEL